MARIRVRKEKKKKGYCVIGGGKTVHTRTKARAKRLAHRRAVRKAKRR